MAIVEFTQAVPLEFAADGAIRIARSRVSLDSIIHHYRSGATVEEITQRFPGLQLADIYSSIAYFLNHPKEIDEYLARRAKDSAALRELIESDPGQQKRLRDIRARISARQS